MLKKLFIIISVGSIYLNAATIGSISTGSENGTYIKIGKDISTTFKKYDVELKVKQSKGSLDNLNMILNLDTIEPSNWAIVQADALQYYKYKYFKKTKQDINNNIKTVLPLYSEAIHIFTKKGKKVKFDAKSTINVGVKSQKSGGYVTSKVISNLYGTQFNFVYCDFTTAKKYLQEGKIDIYVDVISKLNKTYSKLKNIDFVVLPPNKRMDQTYIKTEFTKKDYPWIEKNFTGYSSPSILITNLVDKRYDQNVAFFVEAILKNSNVLISEGSNKWKIIFQELESNHKQVNYHPQAKRIIYSHMQK